MTRGGRDRSHAQLPPPEARAAAIVVELRDTDEVSVRGIMERLPDPTALLAGSLVLVRGEVSSRSLGRRVLAMLGRAASVPRALRCTALLARGYVEVGGGCDDEGDLAWGRAPDPGPTGPARV